MKSKIVVVCVAAWVACLLGGWAWDRLVQHNLHGSIAAKQLGLQKLSDLYGAGLYAEIIHECDSMDADANYRSLRPQVLYMRWAANRALGCNQQAFQAQQSFLALFPEHPLAADMHYERAMDALAQNDFPQAETELRSVSICRPRSKLADRTTKILVRLYRQRPTSRGE
jgi:outer membrane protein assembly factor BamD (BamD/ComL family)